MTDRTVYGFLHSGRLTNADPEREFLKAVDGEVKSEVVPNAGPICSEPTSALTGDQPSGKRADDCLDDDCLDCDCGVDPKHDCFAPPWAHAEDCPYRTQKPRTVTTVTVYEGNTIEVFRAEYSGCLMVVCHRHNAQIPALLGAVWCCDWSLSMFTKYFEGRFNQRRFNR